MTKRESLLKPLIELTLASVFWGFGFVATIWALQTLSFPAVIVYRFLFAFAAGALFWFWKPVPFSEIKKELELSRSAGFWLALTLILQTWGLHTTSASKSAFITVLYVVFVPLLAAVLDREKLSLRNTVALIVALIGVSLIVQVDLSGLSHGDLLTLGNAMTAAVHIRIMGKLAPRSKNHFTFNVLQCFWTMLFCLPLMALEFASPDLFQGSWNLFDLSREGWIGVLALAFGSNLLSFYLQVRAQEKISSSLAAIFFLMESPFSMFFGAWFLQERLSPIQLMGCGLIFVACLYASLPKKIVPGAHAS